MKKNKLPPELKRKNYVVMLIIFSIIALIYAVTIVKLSA